MKTVIFIIALVLLMLIVFTAANWNVLITPTPLSFVVFSVDGPLGVILLCAILGIIMLVVAYALILRTSWLMESKRLNRQLEEQRQLAQQAEASRIVALQDLIEHEFERMNVSISKVGETGLARVESAEQSLAKVIEENMNSIMAHIGYLDDKLKGNS